jgi:SAM-dependent methyltransferase
MWRPHLALRVRLRRLFDLRYWLMLRGLESGRPADYHAYLEGQLRRSLSKRTNDPGVGARLLIREVAMRVGRGARVLCVGCRNGLELDRFRRHGLEPVGIDLFSQRSDILVMDMHDMEFEADSFDAVYASHVLEHSRDLDSVVSEIGRVARDGAIVGVEVPVRHKGSDADLIEFDGLDDLQTSLGPAAQHALYADEQPRLSPTNEQGSAVARLVFRLEQAPSTARVPARTAARPAWRRTRTKVAVGVCALIVSAFALPEAFGDRPYNPLGRHATHAPATSTVSKS